MLDDPGALFDEILGAFTITNPGALRTLFALWQSTPPMTDKVRWMYPVVWREPGFPDMNLRGAVNRPPNPRATPSTTGSRSMRRPMPRSRPYWQAGKVLQASNEPTEAARVDDRARSITPVAAVNPRRIRPEATYARARVGRALFSVYPRAKTTTSRPRRNGL